MSPTLVDVHTVGCRHLEHTAQTVTVTGVDDFVDGLAMSCYTIATAAASVNGYRTTAAWMPLTWHRSRTSMMRQPRITVTAAISGPTTEAGGTATFTIELEHVTRRLT